MTNKKRKLVKKRGRISQLSASGETEQFSPETMRKWAGEYYRPIKKLVTLRVDADVLAWFKKPGARYQTRINEALRKAMTDGSRKAGE
jgi:uncharacterized protein (DUF4415 family)